MAAEDNDPEARELAASWKPSEDEAGAGSVPPAEPTMCNLASLAFALALLGLFSCGITSLVAIPLGISALAHIRRAGGRLTGRALAVWAVIVSVAFLLGALLVAALVGIPSLHMAHEGARRATCMSSLRQIGLAIIAYGEVHDAQMPEGLDDICPAYLSDSQVLVCPNDKAPLRLASGLTTSYRYVGPLAAGTDGSVVIACERAGNHPDGRSVLLRDGRVEFVPEADISDRLARSLALVRVHWDECSPERREQIEKFYAGRAAP